MALAEWEARACHGLGSLRESGVALIVVARCMSLTIQLQKVGLVGSV